MKKLITAFAVTTLVAGSLCGAAFAGQNLNGNGFPTGRHFDLNIIGVQKDKVASMDFSNRHTIFVPLYTGGDVPRQVKIEYVAGEDFQVLDGNATNDNYALIQVPYEYCGDLTAGCTNMLSYNVYARAVGKPGGTALVTAECEYTLSVVDPNGTAGLTCEDTLLMGSFDVIRAKGKPQTQDISGIFRATGCLDQTADGVCNTGDLEFRNLWIFNIPQLDSYMWNYDNNGLKNMQIRFYETVSGYIGTVK